MKKFLSVFILSVVSVLTLSAKTKFTFSLAGDITKTKNIGSIAGFSARFDNFSFFIDGGAEFALEDFSEEEKTLYPLSIGAGYHFLSIKNKWDFAITLKAKDIIEDWDNVSVLIGAKAGYSFSDVFSLNTGINAGYSFKQNGGFLDKLYYEGFVGVGFSFFAKDTKVERQRKNDDIYFLNEETRVLQNAKNEKKQTNDDELIVLSADEYSQLLLGIQDEKRAEELALKLNKEIESDERSAEEIIDDNNKRAKISVESNENYFGAICRYIYKREKIYDVFCTPRTNTDIRLKEGERVVDVRLGDSENWMWDTLLNIEEGKEVQHILFRPNNVRIKTDGAIYTNQRTYFINLISCEREYQVRLEWIYPKNEKSISGASFTSERGKKIGGVENLVFNYRIKGNAHWKPKRVYSDGERTYIQFANSFKNNSTAPIVFIRNIETQEEKYTNVLVNKITYILPFIISADEEIVLKSDKETIRIERE